MQKKNKLEVIGFILMLIGGLFWLSEDMFPIEALGFLYPIAQILLWVGVVIWALGYMKKEKKALEQKKND